MASNSPNMKVNVTADTSEFQKGMKESKAALRDFDKTSKNALGNLGNLFGVNTGKVTQMTNAIKGMGLKLSSSTNAGVASMGKLVASAGAATTAFASIGLGAAVAAFKLLNDEASNFKSTVQGANIELQTQAYLSTYKQVLHDSNAEMGKAVAETEASIKKGLGGAWARTKTGAVNFVNALVHGKDAAAAITESIVKTGVASAQAAGKGKQAEAIAKRIYDLQRQQSDNQVKIARYDADIAKYREISTDKTKTTEERAQALAKVEELIKKKYELQLPIQQKLAKAMEDMNALASSTPEQIDAANRARVEAIQLEAREADELRALNRQQAAITSEIEAGIKARNKALFDTKLGLSEGAKNLTGLSTGVGAIKVPVVVEVSREDLIRQIEQTKALIADAFSSIGDSLGTMIGDLLTGEDAFKNFGSSALAAFGDMATTVGQMAIATGTATLAIQKSLVTLQGWGAIAAGVALVALGSAVKTGLANVAGGNYHASTNVSSGSYSAASSAAMMQTSSMQINVTGKLYGQGSQLVAVINNEKNRTEHTT